MYKISRFIIFLPIVILILFLALHDESPKRSSTTSVAVPSVAPNQNTVATGFPKSVSPKAPLNLKGPYRCEFSDKDIQVKAYIQNKKIYVEFTQKKQINFALVNGDCGYKWKQGETIGEKMCGIGMYLSLFESFSSMPFFDIKSIFSMIGQAGPAISIAPAQLSSIADSCKKEPVDESVFTVPSSIVFSNVQKTIPSEKP